MTGRKGRGMERAGPHTHVWEIKIGKNISGAKGPRCTPGPQARVAVTGREVTITAVCKKQQGLRLWERHKLLDSQALPLKGLTHGLAQTRSL